MTARFPLLLTQLVLTSLAGATLAPVFEYSFTASYDGTGTIVTDQSAAGNHATMTGENGGANIAVSTDIPAGATGGSHSLDYSTTYGVIRTDANSLLNNAAVVANGGFTMTAWFKGLSPNIRKVVDYAGTEYIGTHSNNGGEVLIGLSNAIALRLGEAQGLLVGDWNQVTYVFSVTNGSDLAAVVGDISVNLNGTTSGASGLTLTNFGDSLNRPIGIGRHPTLSADHNRGQISEPAVYLGVPVYDPSLATNPTALDFGVFGASPGPQTLELTITNDGATQDLTIDTIAVTGFDATSFSVGPFPGTIGPGTSTNVTITFDPGSITGLFEAALEIGSDAPNRPRAVVPLNAEVYDPIAVVTPSPLDFGDFGPSPGLQTRNLTIANQGTSNSLSITRIAVDNDPDGVFSVGTFPASLAPGTSTDVTVSFDPGSADGFFAATLQIDTDGANQDLFDVPLTAGVKVADPDASLVSHFTFNDAGNPGDDTGLYNNDGTVVGDAQHTAVSRIGAGALLLDGDGDVIQLAGTGDDYSGLLIANAEGFTAACWAITPANSPSIRTRFFSSYQSPGAWGAGHADPNGLLATTYGLADYLTAEGTAPARGEWHHFAYVFRGNPVHRVDYYVDGALVDSQIRAQSGLNVTTGDFAIGGKAAADPDAEQFHGRIDDLRIYDRELLEANIADLVNAAPPLTGYNAWANSFGLDPAGTGTGAPDQDPDLDKVDNGVEFMLGTSPVDGVQANLPHGTPGTENLTFAYQRQTAATTAGFLDRTEFGTDLQNWTTAVHDEGGVTIAVTTIDANTEEVTVTIPLNGAPELFARLVVDTP